MSCQRIPIFALGSSSWMKPGFGAEPAPPADDGGSPGPERAWGTGGTPDPDNTLYLELAHGRVVIELAPSFAPNHVANVKALAREHYYDGLAVLRCQDNYVTQWGDPDAETPSRARKIQRAKRTLLTEFDRALDPGLPFTRLPDGDVYAPEVGFTEGFPVARDPKTGRCWLTHCYGMVGAGRDTSADSGGGTELYVVIGQAPRHLDRNVTLLGRVVQGMELLSGLPRGTGPLGFYEKPGQRVPIKAANVAADSARRRSAPPLKSSAPTRLRSNNWLSRAATGARNGFITRRAGSNWPTSPFRRDSLIPKANPEGPMTRIFATCVVDIGRTDGIVVKYGNNRSLG